MNQCYYAHPSSKLYLIGGPKRNLLPIMKNITSDRESYFEEFYVAVETATWNGP